MGLQRGVLLYMDHRHTEGKICEVILAEYFLRHDHYVFIPIAGQGPADLIVINGVTAEVILLDAKKDCFRYVKDRPVYHRVHRKRTPIQKKLGVRMAYVNIDTREVHIVPPLEGFGQAEITK